MKKEHREYAIGFAVDVIAIYAIILMCVYFFFGKSAMLWTIGGLTCAVIWFLWSFKPWLKK